MVSDWKKDSDMKRLYRSGKDKFLGGVCGGIGEYFGIDPMIVRIIWVILAIASLGTALLVYIILWIFIPRNPKHPW
ncbi:MAG: PspC domain-containing protein [Candidatus Thermoplasmatota archaeon]